MASIQNSRAKKYARLMVGDEPTEHLESIGDCLIKELAEKQTDTKLTLEKQFSQEKQFQRGSGFVSLSSFSAGTSSLENFQKKTKDVEVLQQLTGRGLTFEEAKRYITGENVLYSKKAEHSALKAQQDLLTQCLEDDAKNNKNTDTSRLSRQERELALSVKPNSVETQLLQFALTCQQPAKVDLRPESHPINKIVEIEKELFKEHVDPQVLAKTVKRKRRQHLDALLPPQHVTAKPVVKKGSSLWDVIDKPIVVENKSTTSIKIYGCTKERLYTIRDGKIVQVKGKEKVESNCEITKKSVDKEQTSCDGQPFVTSGEIVEKNFQNGKRLTENEIKRLPRFKNYERGQSNKVLYIKNIATNVKEEDLVTVFGKFQDPGGPKLIYRLMNGKMRGQAFITFPNTEKATEALDSVNGLELKGKPLIIQFGRESNG